MVLELKPNEQKYRVNWSMIPGGINNIYLIITAKSKIKVIEDGQLKLKDRESFSVPAIFLPRVGSLKYSPFPDGVKNALFSFSLARDEMGSDIYERYEKNIYIGDKETLWYSNTEVSSDMQYIELSCRFKLEENMFGFRIGDEQACPLITLPEMRREKELYLTSCYLKREACQKMKISFIDDIADLMQCKKDTRGR